MQGLLLTPPNLPSLSAYADKLFLRSISSQPTLPFLPFLLLPFHTLFGKE